jgi:starch synthase
VKRLKVAFVSFYFGEYCVRLASGIAEDPDTDILLLLPSKEAAPYLHLLSKSVELQVFDTPRMRHPFKHIQMLAFLVRQIRSFNPDVIHLQLGHLSFNLFALPLLKNYPLVLTVHDALIHSGDAASGKTPQWVYDRACYRARERIVHAPQVKELLLQRMRIPSDTISVIPHVLIGEDSALVGEKPQSEEPEVLFFGRIWEYKGLEYLIRAEPLITSMVPEAKIVIAGKGEDFGRYRRMMVHPEKFIVHNEYISDKKRATLFRRASVVVLPYTEASQSGVIPVAYSFCKPVVATTVGGLPEMVDHGRTGYLVPPRDVDALAEAIVILLQDKGLRKQFGENGRRKINAECSPEVVGRMTRLVYDEAVRERERP